MNLEIILNNLGDISSIICLIITIASISQSFKHDNRNTKIKSRDSIKNPNL